MPKAMQEVSRKKEKKEVSRTKLKEVVGQHNAYKLENTVDFTINADIFWGYE